MQKLACHICSLLQWITSTLCPKRALYVTRPMIGYLKYVVRNCRTAVDELCTMNSELREGVNPDSTADINRLRAHERMVKDYLVIRVAGLFDKDTRAISLYNDLPKNRTVKEIESEPIIKKIKESRDRFVAHSDRDHIETEDFIVPTEEIYSSNIRDLLERLEKVLNEAELKN